MLILPLHHPLTRRTFPFATAVLILLNVFVFVFLQSGDGRVYAEAARHYGDSGLAEIEAPLYQSHLQEADEGGLRETLEQLPEAYRGARLAQAAQQDEAFRARLAAGELFADAEAWRDWQPLAETFEQLRNRAVTQRFALNAGEPGPKGLLGSMFLHGGWEHLFGNMLFLGFLGLLVEGALGPWRFTGLYLVSGIGAGLAWVAWEGGAPALLVGASGAIAGLMGALAVLWGSRRIRFFYWFFILFDYVKAPAILLLPAWLGWELFQLFAIEGSRVAYAAHAGGIVAGALLALGARQFDWVREDFMADEPDAPRTEDHLAQALAHLGQMRLIEAEALLAPLAEAEPQRLDVALARYRVARYGQKRVHAGLLDRAHAVLDARAGSAADTREQWAILQDLAKLELRADGARVARFSARLAAIGEAQAALELLETVDAERAPDLDLAQHWLSLALRLSEHGNATLGQRALRGLVQRFPQAPQAQKARFLLSEG